MNKFKLTIGSVLIAFLAVVNSVKPAEAHSIAQPHIPTIHALNIHAASISASRSFFQRATLVNPINIASGIQHSYLINSNTVQKVTVSEKLSVTSPKSSIVSVTTVPTTDAQADQDITNVLNSDWASWTGSTTKSLKPLTIAEVSKLLASPTITGSQAAVLGMIADQMYSDAGTTKKSPSYTFQQATAFLLGTSTSSSALFVGTDPITGRAMNAEQFSNAMSQITSSTNANGSFSLYGSYSQPYLSITGPTVEGATIQQAFVGDCFFLSAVDSILMQNPQFIASMITQNANGKFTVSFPTGKKETVSLTDGEIGAFSNAQNNGCWLAVMGMAENAVLKTETGVPACLKTAPLGLVADGGEPVQTLGLLTGSPYTQKILPALYTINSLDSLISHDMAQGVPLGIESSDHALSIIGINVNTQTVWILNPWGVSAPYGANQDPGIALLNANMEVNMTNGWFTLSTSQLIQDFISMTIPTAQTSMLTPIFGFGSARSMPTLPTRVGPNPGLGAGDLHQAPAKASLVDASKSLAASPSSPSSRESTNRESNSTAPQDIANVETNQTTLAGAQAEANIHSLNNTLADQDVPVYEAGQGSFFVMPANPVQIHTSKAEVNVSAHAAALIVQIGDEVAVSNLADKREGDIVLAIGGEKINVPMGKTIILSAANIDDPAKTQLLEVLDGKNASFIGKYNDSNAFLGRVSYIWALKNCPQFSKLIHSSDAEERKAARQVLKACAAVMTLAQGI